MKAKVYLKENGRLKVKNIDAETEEDVCYEVFELEHESSYTTEAIGVRFPDQKIMPWYAVFANYCWGKGRMSFDEFKKACYGPQIYVTVKEVCHE